MSIRQIPRFIQPIGIAALITDGTPSSHALFLLGVVTARLHVDVSIRDCIVIPTSGVPP